MDSPTTGAGISLGFRSTLSVARSRWDLRWRLRATSESHGYQRSTLGSALAVATSLRRARDRNDSARVPGSSDRLQRGFAAPNPYVCISITITDPERIWPWTRIRRSRGQSSRRNLGLWFPCRKSAGPTPVTNDAPPELLTSKSLRPRRTTARRWAFYGDFHSQLTKIASGALARILLAPPETRSYSRTSNTDGVCGRHSRRPRNQYRPQDSQ